jgi:hypothetical protein
MPYDDPSNVTRLLETVRASLIMLAFGVAVLVFLIAIERPQWFHIQPGTSTALAISKAAADGGKGVVPLP